MATRIWPTSSSVRASTPSSAAAWARKPTRYGIIPVAGYCGDADTAAQLLVIGQLPTSDGGGCSGCHGGDEGGEDCGCGCGCGC